jgi:hypothetical protein
LDQDLPIATKMTLVTPNSAFLLCAVIVGQTLAAQSMTPAAQNSLSQQEQSIAVQMNGMTSMSALKQVDSFRQQSESFRVQQGASQSAKGQAVAATQKGDVGQTANTVAKDTKAAPATNTDIDAAYDTHPGFYTVPWPGFSDLLMPNVQVQTTACDALERTEAESLITAASGKNNISPVLLRSVMKQESGFRPCALSTAGAMGLMQIMPETAADLGLTDPFDPAMNVDAGARYLKQMLDRYHGNTALALAAYNAGPGRTDKANGAIPAIAETIGYVSQILGNIPLF